ncbi:DUF262 domain-containing protein [Sphingomonas sp.]|uniref:GmrSD restriction endonuclease domain-containing protein n=1 Tax=Sphingomonas sp. TaxID=28214 RepID=UPI0017F73524|nr:DUF262 domain-containing protein [Sphingomonas sp.]MBA3510459.1 DUF262 domain-containing protein [Sphingomonas sp.]
MSALFSTLSFQLGQLVNMIDDGSIGLPEIQRPFVWKKTKVRDLFDSMFRGFPVGYFLFWKNSSAGAKQIGVATHQLPTDRMIVDGQQRLTSLYAVLKGVPVIDENYARSKIEIAFNPSEATFAVTSAAHRRSAHWIPDISVLWDQKVGLFSLVGTYIERLKQEQEVAPELQRTIENNVQQLYKLNSYSFTAIELSADTEPEAVSDIFVRINSAGVELNQADFILTLMSVYWDAGRKELEAFCRAAKMPDPGRPSPFNHFLDPSPAELLRVTVGYGFRRGRLRSVYNLLRGKELDDAGVAAGAKNFETLKQAQDKVLSLSNWHQFLHSVMLAGFRSGRLITSTNTILYSYVLFLIGKIQHEVPLQKLKVIIAKWIFMSAITSRYTGSYETQIEADLNRLGQAETSDAFAEILERIIGENLTEDFWNIALPAQFETTASRSPTLYAYYAALSLLKARVLFSPMTVSDLLDPAVRGDRLAVERHHLFPVAYLKANGIDAARDIDQIANFALVEWPDNASIGANPPAVYATALMASLSPDERERQSFWHALPDDWMNMPYAQFVSERRKKLAAVVRAGFERIGSAEPESGSEPHAKDLHQLILAGESTLVEFKSTARWSLNDGKVHDGVEFAIARTIAGFLNTSGGTLVIGIADDGSVVGLQHDYATLKKKDRDGFELFLYDLLSNALGKNALSWLQVAFHSIDERDVAVVTVKRSPNIVFTNPRGPKVDDVYVRFGNSTRKLTPAEMLQYMSETGTGGPSQSDASRETADEVESAEGELEAASSG